jgi:hypothetical protein
LNAVEEARELFARADVVECLENTYIPGREGLRLKLRKVGRTVVVGIQENGDRAGEPFHLTFPKRVRDVVDVTNSQVTYRIGRKDHTVTYRIAVEAQARRSCTT